MPVSTIHISADAGGSFEAFVAVPKAGKGPGLLLCPEIYRLDSFLREVAEVYAAEGYTVVAPDVLRPVASAGSLRRGTRASFDVFTRFDMAQALEDLEVTIQAMRRMPEVVGRIGALGHSLGALLALLVAARNLVDCAVAYHPIHLQHYLRELSGVQVPIAVHFAEVVESHAPGDLGDFDPKSGPGAATRRIYFYPDAHPSFALTGSPHYQARAAQIAHQRSIMLFRATLGPHYDFSALWDRHCASEFETRDVDATMATMVVEPYVNHIPTMTGGVGRDELQRFYREHFIPSTPSDTRLIPISRTVGEGSLVDELLFCFTHSIEIDWMLPGIPPTGRYVEIPLVAIVRFRGDLIYNEHIYWDQASVLVQIGLLDPHRIPVAGIEATRKLLDPSLPSNTLMAAWHRSAEPSA